MAWELLTQVWKLDPRILHVSCYEGSAGGARDEEAADICARSPTGSGTARSPMTTSTTSARIISGKWAIPAPAAPAPKSTSTVAPRRRFTRRSLRAAAPRSTATNPRVMEIWNNVFIQYDRDAAGKLTTLPAQHVDTGMGLERLCQVLQDKEDNYATDLFRPIFESISQISSLKYTGQFPPTNAADPELEAKTPQLRIDIASASSPITSAALHSP